MNKILILPLLAFVNIVFSQRDIEFVLHESAINKMLDKIGYFSGTQDYEVFIVRGKYTWKAEKISVKLHPVQSYFYCTAHVTTGLFNYSTPVEGKIRIQYDSLRDKIQLILQQADFEIYTKFAGRKIHLKTIHLEEYIREPFEFDGPGHYPATFDIQVSDSVRKSISVKPVRSRLLVLEKKILIYSQLDITEKTYKKDTLQTSLRDTLSPPPPDKK
jgi:hypothetical protein